ncbi:hypothetical protein N7462_011713 [Penicillium macrosclerotiorum]|uniref:uncharacterized protein n=1 Tax=Penicillium macrosclerotiorum TaxID=303699 RepID=UPI00254668BE|nr:uncharacterized protein N7462_011713 [Penicillium macrosclerotiorum]KAJ5662787.1 hypothetical protein N7462_011713 [Penicillium macrosclerotiorum]
MSDSSDGGYIADRGTQLMIEIWVLTSLAVITVILRFSSRGMRGKFGWDDFLIFFSLLCFLGCSICLTFLCVNHGERHLDDLQRVDGTRGVDKIKLYAWIGSAFGTIGLVAGKVSIATLLLSILGHTNWLLYKAFLWVFCIGLAVPVSTAYAIFGLVQCSPPAALWDSSVKGTCVQQKVVADYGAFTGCRSPRA